MTSEAVQAWRLFDGKYWTEAIPLLEAVALGRHGDCLGDRELAEYKLAIALTQDRDWTAATDLFVAIGERPHHVKHHETLLWLVKAATEHCPTRRVLQTLVLYPMVDAPFSNPRDQRLDEVYLVALFARARGLQEAGRSKEARRLFETLSQESTLDAVVAECLAQMSQE